MPTLVFPRDKETLAQHLADLYSANETTLVSEHSHRLRMVRRYVLGKRRGLVPVGGGQAGVSEDRFGNRYLLWEECLKIRGTEIGRVLSMDEYPAVQKPEGMSLEDLRSSSVQQALLDYRMATVPLSQLKLQTALHMIDYGTVGQCVYDSGLPILQLAQYIEIVPAWELMPAITGCGGRYEMGGELRRRWVDIEWLREAVRAKGYKMPKPDSFGAVDSRESPILPGDPSENDKVAMGAARADDDNKRDSYNTATAPWSKKRGLLLEVFLDGPIPGSLSRYICAVGPNFQIIADTDFLEAINNDPLRYNELPVKPLTTGVYTETGSYYGRGLMDRIIPFNNQIERAAANVFQNLEDYDWMGMNLVPSDFGLNLAAFKGTHKRRFATYNRDPESESAAVHSIAPNSTMDAPARVLQLMMGMLGSLAGHGDLYSGKVPNRTAARTLGVAVETANVPFAMAGHYFEHIFQGTYRALYKGLTTSIPDNFEFKVQRMDEMILGLLVDMRTGMTKVPDDILPDAYRYKTAIRGNSPQSNTQKVASLYEQLSAGVISPNEFNILKQRENTGLAVANRAEYEAYRKAWFENIVMFGDGETPGIGLEPEDARLEGLMAFMNPGDIHTIHSAHHAALAASLAFGLASREVRTLVLNHMAMHDSVINVPFDITAEANGRVGPMSPQLMQQLNPQAA